MMTSGSGEGWFLEMEERRIDLREGEVTLGRSRGCGVVLRDPSVSRGHALLSVRQGRVTLQDLRSSNGTYVNGKRLDKETVIEEGDRVVIGETELFLRRAWDGQPSRSDGRRTETGEVSLFCPVCGLPIHGSAGGRCPVCGAELTARPPRVSEAYALGEILPVGEVLGASTDSAERTSYRQRAATRSREFPTPVPPPAPVTPFPEPADRAATAETRARNASGPRRTPPTVAVPPALSELPMSVREAESRTPTTRERSAIAAALTPMSPPPPPSLWSRLVGFLRGRR
jgi:predicted component of type VI protein secretion system